MSRRQKDPLRALAREERQWLQRIARSPQEPASHVVRAKQLLAVAMGQSYTAAAVASECKSGDAVSQVVGRFNREGLQAVAPRARSGRKPTYGITDREQILAEARRQPDAERDGSATWSLTLLQRALRTKDPLRFGRVSTYTIRAMVQGAGCRRGRSRRWCETGGMLRKRKRGAVWVTDPETEAKKVDRARLYKWRATGVHGVDVR
jgi:transposase